MLKVRDPRNDLIGTDSIWVTSIWTRSIWTNLCPRICPLIPVNIVKSFAAFEFGFLMMDVVFNCFFIIEIALRISASRQPKVDLNWPHDSCDRMWSQNDLTWPHSEIYAERYEYYRLSFRRAFHNWHQGSIDWHLFVNHIMSPKSCRPKSPSVTWYNIWVDGYILYIPLLHMSQYNIAYHGDSELASYILEG